MMSLSQLKAFWKIILPTVAIVLVTLICAIFVASRLIKSVYMTNLEQQLNKSSLYVSQRLDDTFKTMQSQISILEKHGDLLAATLYAFDDLVDDDSFLTAELESIRETSGVDAVIIKASDSADILSNVNVSVMENDSILRAIVNQNGADNINQWLMIDGKMFMVANGHILHFGENLASLYLLKEIGNDYLKNLTRGLSAEMMLMDTANNVLAESSHVVLNQSVTCDKNKPTIVADDSGNRYYYGCVSLAQGGQLPVIVSLYNSEPLWHAMKRTNIYLWAVGSVLIGISIFFTLMFCKSYISPLKKLARLMDVEETDDLTEAFKRLAQGTMSFQTKLANKSRLEALGQSTAMVAHDVRKPLASMKALLTALPSIKDDPIELKKIVTTVDRNISHTNAMLNDVLEFSRDSTSLDLKENNPSGLITSALGDALRNHPGSNVQIEYNLKHLYALRSDVVRITRVLTNVIDNALDAMTSPQTGKTSGELRFETYEARRDEQEVGGIVVSDNGPGIPKDALDRIFDPFFTRGKKSGTGLGLAICHRVISLHGGTIRADNREDGRGARFTIELPLGKDRVGLNESELISHSSELEQFRIEESQRVDYGDTANTSEFLRINKERGRKSFLLILDDEPLFRESIRAILNELKEVRDHVKVVEAESSETAFRIFDAREFDYVIADIDLGRGQMNGYEFSQIVLKKYPSTRVLIHSNKRKGEMDRNIRSTASDKFMGFLPKPMRSAELLQFLACKTFETPSNYRTIEPSNRRKVLVVNDDDSLIVAFKIQLRAPDVQVLSAGNVSDALKRITEQKVDVILSDINLGSNEPSGYELLKKVREKDKSVPFYMISGYSEADEGPKARDMGATGYLQLPVEGAQLKRTILPTSS